MYREGLISQKLSVYFIYCDLKIPRSLVQDLDNHHVKKEEAYELWVYYYYHVGRDLSWAVGHIQDRYHCCILNVLYDISLTEITK